MTQASPASSIGFSANQGFKKLRPIRDLIRHTQHSSTPIQSLFRCRTMLNTGWIFCYALLLVSITSCQFLPPGPSQNPNLLLGNPSQATASITTPNNYLIERPQYVVSYNRDQGIPNWASWQLQSSWLGTLPRQEFLTDPNLPEGWYRVTPQDYSGSGFDRGHLVPAADRDKTTSDRQAVFWMSNILPQAPEINRGPWEQLERYCRELAQNGHELAIIAGGAGIGGQGAKGQKTRLGKGRVVVPAVLWKIIVVLPRPGVGIKGITAQTRIITVIIPNQNRVKSKNWYNFSTSVRAVESLTGYDFLSNLPSGIQTALETKVDSRRGL